MNLIVGALAMSKNTVSALKPHISLNVKNVKESVEFYKRLFGIEPMKFIRSNANDHSALNENEGPRIGYAKFEVEDPALNFVLNEVPYAQGGSLSHLGIQVASTNDVLETRARWIESGLLTADEMKVDCCYALQDKTWTRDPDGNEWEVFVVLENTEPTAEACACGDRVGRKQSPGESNDEKPVPAAHSAVACCTPGQKASTIGATNQPCC